MMGSRTFTPLECGSQLACEFSAIQPLFTAEIRKDSVALSSAHDWKFALPKFWGSASFENVAMKAGVEMGRWSWSTDAWDFDHDGFPDLYIANGYISGAQERDVSSFFWRQVVANSPPDSSSFVRL